MTETVKTLEGRWTAESSIAHGSDENFGMEQQFRKEKFVIREDGEERVEEIPAISGNSLRGQLRDLLAKDFLDRLDVELHDPLFHVFYGGGMLERGSGSGKIQTGLIQDIREYVPSLSLLGTAAESQMISGKMNMGWLIPIAAETASRTGVDNDLSIMAKMGDTHYTRQDDREGGTDRGQDEQAQQMLYRVQVLAAGTKFFHRMTLKYTSPIEEACLYHAFDLFEQSPHIGGMAGKGHGRVSFDYDPALGSAEPYIEFIEENREDIREFVLDLDETLAN